MKKYTDRQVEILRSTSMRDILAVEGHDTTHTRGGLYFSPFRTKERTPSLHIDDANHRWFDHGAPETGVDGKRGGDTVAFVQLLKGCSFLDALGYLCRFHPDIVPNLEVEAVKVPQMKDRIIADGSHGGDYLGTTIVCAQNPFLDPKLIAFAQGRGVGAAMLQRYCEEVYYDMRFLVGGIEKTIRHHAIGFPNSDGGWVLRYIPERGGDKGKRSTGGYATMFDRNGMLILSDDLYASAPSVVVFEGFMDFLSFMEDKRPGGTPDDMDVVVLNSVANLDRSLDFILMHGNVLGLLDSDASGTKTTATLAAACKTAGRRFYDRRNLLLGHKDYNDMWQAKLAAAKMAG